MTSSQENAGLKLLQAAASVLKESTWENAGDVYKTCFVTTLGVEIKRLCFNRLQGVREELHEALLPMKGCHKRRTVTAG